MFLSGVREWLVYFEKREMDLNKMMVVQCWDDGVTADERLVDVLRHYGAKATFNLCAGLYDNERKFGWMHGNTEVWRLGRNEMRDLYKGFTIASHSLTHPYLDQLSHDALRWEIREGRERLQQFFGQAVEGFAYPFGAYNDTVMEVVAEAGHTYARAGAVGVPCSLPPPNAMVFHPSCHFLAHDFWERYEEARPYGVFYFWGHSYEMIHEDMWTAFAEKMRRISADPASFWADVCDLFHH